MPYNTNPTTGDGPDFASDDLAEPGVKHPYVKLEYGADGSKTEVSPAAPLPVVQTGALPAGTNNIGDVDVLTLPALPAGTNNIGDVDVLTLPTLPAGDNNIGNVDIVTMPAISGTVSISGAVDTELPAAVALADNTANPTVPGVGAFLMCWDSGASNWDRVTTSGSGVLNVAQVGNVTVVDGGGSLTVDNAALAVVGGGTEATALRVTLANDSTGLVSVDDNGGSLTVDNAALSTTGNGTAAGSLRVTVASDSTGTVAVTQATAANLNAEVQGDVAHDSAVGGNPVLVGAYADTTEDSDANTSANRVSADADVVRLAADRYGVLRTTYGSPFQFSFSNQSSSAQTDTSVHAAPAAGLSIYVTSIYVACNGAVTVTVEEGTATFKWRYYGAAAGDGANCTFPVPIKITAATALTYTTSGAIEHTIVVCGFIAPG